MIAAVLIFTTLFLTVLTMFSSTHFERWWIRGTDFPRLQFTFLGIILLLTSLFLLNLSLASSWIIIITVSLCTIYHLIWIMPYTKLYPHQVLQTNRKDPLNTISVLVANVLQTNDCFSNFLRIIQEKNPLVFVTLETNKIWQKHLDQLEVKYPYSVKCPKENFYGMHVYSQLPLIDSEIQFLEVDDIPSIHTAVKLRSGQFVSLHFMHPIPPRPGQTGESSQRDAELLVVGKTLIKRERPVIVSGDLNDVAWSKTTRLFLKTSHLLDPRIGRGMYNSFNAFYWFLRWPLDHLFHSDHFTLSRIERLSRFGSDHFPVFIELVYDESKRDLQRLPSPDEEEKKLAKQKISSERVEVKDVHSPSKSAQ